MKEIGALLYLDVIINNGDRLPLIWQNQGNSGNLMLDKITGQVISLDTSCNVINNDLYPEKVEEYYTKIREFVENLKEHKDQVIEPFQYIGQTIFSFSGYNVGEDGAKLIQEGFINAFKHMKSLNITEEQITTWKNMINGLQITDIPEYVSTFITNIFKIFDEILS